jgi:hypothetical protein
MFFYPGGGNMGALKQAAARAIVGAGWNSSPTPVVLCQPVALPILAWQIVTKKESPVFHKTIRFGAAGAALFVPLFTAATAQQFATPPGYVFQGRDHAPLGLSPFAEGLRAGAVGVCARRFRSFDASTGSYTAFSGERLRCPIGAANARSKPPLAAAAEAIGSTPRPF